MHFGVVKMYVHYFVMYMNPCPNITFSHKTTKLIILILNTPFTKQFVSNSVVNGHIDVHIYVCYPIFNLSSPNTSH